jgi:hypothetical protein
LQGAKPFIYGAFRDGAKLILSETRRGLSVSQGTH